ncbi:MAG: alpha/beta hydrolase [Microbacteriaceae bacterium]|nr:alpha/beta hydrolase [Microbacteriaceae bacterium]
MRLHTDVYGAGNRTALVVHGIMSDHRCWHRLIGLLVDRGYRVVTVDLAGHGRSPRSRRYSPASWAEDVIESVSGADGGPSVVCPELVVGHSLGGLVTSIVVESLTPQRVIYIDPAFSAPTGWRKVLVGILLATLRTPTKERIARGNPRWSAEDVEIETETIALWDRRTVFGLARASATVPPTALVAPSLLVLADHSRLVPEPLAKSMAELGMQVEVVQGAGHVVFRDDFEGFLAKADAWF